MNIKLLQSFYSGFEINEPAGNNAFSYGQRQNKSIWVPPLIPGALTDVTQGDKIVFSEIEDGVEKNRNGLKNFVYLSYHHKNIFIFDNHNHAFFFWMTGYLQDKINPGLPLVHIDQHSDMREPPIYPGFSLDKKTDVSDIFNYTNYTLNVGSFIQPALRLGLFSEVQIIDSSTTFTRDMPARFVLDIDMDIFSEEMAYIDETLKRDKIRRYIKAAEFITIATSPYFMNQKKAVSLIRKFFTRD